MKSTEHLLAASLLGTSLVLGGCGGMDTEPKEATIVQNDPGMEASMVKLRNYWIGRGVAQAADVKLVTISAGTMDCVNLQYITTTLRASETNGAYCAPATIVVGKKAVETITANAIHGGYSVEDAELTLAAHEFGHDIQYNTVSGYGEQQIVEQNADCMAGQAIRDINPDAYPAVDKVYYTFGSDPEHGSPEERLAAFKNGFDGGKQAFCGANILPPEPSASN